MKRLEIRIGGASLELIVSGSQPGLDAYRDELRQIVTRSATIEEGIEESIAALTRFDVQLVEITRSRPITEPRQLASLIRVAANLPTAEAAWALTRAVLLDATDQEFEALIQSTDLHWSRSFIQGVLTGLDEREDSAREELGKLLAPHVAYLLID